MAFTKFGNALSMHPTTRVSLVASGDRVLIGGRVATVISVDGNSITAVYADDGTQRVIPASAVQRA